MRLTIVLSPSPRAVLARAVGYFSGTWVLSASPHCASFPPVKTTLRVFAFVALSISPVFTLQAQVYDFDGFDEPPRANEPLVTDRPDITESSLTVPVRHFQLESGIQFDSFRNNDESDMRRLSDIFGLPTKLRYGILDNFEAHVESTLFNRSSFDLPTQAMGSDDDDNASESEGGLANLDIGGKVNFIDQPNGRTPSFGTIVAITLPVGNDNVASDTTRLRAQALVDWDLRSWLSFGANGGFSLALNDRDFNTDFLLLSGSLGLHPENALPGVGFFAELFAQVSLDGDFGNNAGTTLGATYLVNNDFQLDAYMRFGFTDSTPDVTGGGGASFRF